MAAIYTWSNPCTQISQVFLIYTPLRKWGESNPKFDQWDKILESLSHHWSGEQEACWKEGLDQEDGLRLRGPRQTLMLPGILKPPIFGPRPLFPARLRHLPLKKRAFIIPILWRRPRW